LICCFSLVAGFLTSVRQIKRHEFAWRKGHGKNWCRNNWCGTYGRNPRENFEQRQEGPSSWGLRGVKERAESLARRCDAKTYLNYRDLVEDRDVGAVYVTTPSAHHVEPVMHAVRCGKHIFSEKPMSTSLESSKGIVEVVEESDVKYQVGHNRRFCPVYKRVKELVVKKSHPLRHRCEDGSRGASKTLLGK